MRTFAEYLLNKTRADAAIHLHVGGKDFPFLAKFKLKPAAELIDTLTHSAAPREYPCS